MSSARYDIMKSCWSLGPKGRPTFQDLVGMLSRLLEMSSDYLDLSQASNQLELSQSLCWKEGVHTCAAALPVIREQDAEDETEDLF